jgi:hypothetical protein
MDFFFKGSQQFVWQNRRRIGVLGPVLFLVFNNESPTFNVI